MTMGSFGPLFDDNSHDNADDSCCLNHVAYTAMRGPSRLVTVSARSWQCAAELRRQSHHDAVGALSSTRTSAALRTMPSGGAVVPPSVVTYMTLPTSPGSRPQ